VVAITAASHALAGRTGQARGVMHYLRQLDRERRISSLKDWHQIRRPEPLATFAHELRRADLPE